MFAMTFMIWALIAAGTTVGMGVIFNKKPQIVQAVLLFVVFYFISWLTLPPIAPDMLGTWFLMLVILVIAAMITGFSSENESFKPALLPVVFGVIMLIGMIGTSGIFNAREMATVINIEDHGQKDTTIELASQDQARRVTPNLALKRAAELIGSAKQPGLASVAEYGEMYGNVTTDGKAVWMAPLEPLNFFRWLSTRSTPGYFIASHVNIMDSRLVEDQPISYGTSGFYFGSDLFRHLYINGYVNYRYGDAFFQVNNEGVPHYVVPLERPQVGFWSYYPEKWVVVNANTGEITPASTHDELPAWVDRAYPQSTMEGRLEDWGCFSAGAWACYISGVEVVDPTPGMVVTMDDSNHMIYYTGTQFQNNKVEGATSGVATINARTGKVEYYRRAGITETAAMQIMNGAISNFAGWDAEDPVLIQVNGMETYFAVITDGSGAKKSYGMVWQRNRDVYGVGKSVEGAVRNYLRSVRNNKNMTSFEGNVEVESIVFEGLVVTITPVSRSGETAFYLRIDTIGDKVFVVNTENPAEVATTNVGEPVRVTTLNAEPGTIEVDTFDNLTLTLSESERQMVKNAETQKVMDRYQEKLQQDDAAAKLRNLSPDQVREVLRALEDQ